jgi:hypothetical protein
VAKYFSYEKEIPRGFYPGALPGDRNITVMPF